MGEEIVALRIQGKGSVFQDVPVPGALSAALLEWKGVQEGFKRRRILHPGGIAFAGSQFVFAGYSGAAIFKPRLQFAAASGVRSARGGGDHSPRVAPFRSSNFAQPGGKGLARNPGVAPPQNIRTTVRYTHVGYEQTRQTAEALSQALE